MNSKSQIQAEEVYASKTPIRLDVFLVNKISTLSRSQLQHAIESGEVRVNGLEQKSKYKLAKGDRVTYDISDVNTSIKDIPAEPIKLNIIFENDDVIVINKQAGLASHPTPQQKTGTLVNALLAYNNAISKVIFDPTSSKSTLRAGIVHRLDKNTTGVMIIAKTLRALKSLSLQMKHRTVTKKYIAICYGWPEQKNGEITSHLGRDTNNRKTFTEVGEDLGKLAKSSYKVKKYLKAQNGVPFSLIEFQIYTGRTHQIRSQAKIFGHPVVGDPMYYNPASRQASRSIGAKRQLLHSYLLRITLPGDSQPKQFTANIPIDIKMILDKLSPVE